MVDIDLWLMTSKAFLYMMCNEILLSHHMLSMMHYMENIVLCFLQSTCHLDTRKDIDYQEENILVYKKYKHSYSEMSMYYKIPNNYSMAKSKDCF